MIIERRQAPASFVEQAGPKKREDLTKKFGFGKIEWSFKSEPSRELKTRKKAVRKVVIKCIFICMYAYKTLGQPVILFIHVI